MADSTNDKRPMRKLTVKNFSVIKDAELEFGKITVLIGPQASGKSLLCKLAYFCGLEIPEIATQSIMNRYQFGGFLAVLRTRFVQRFTVLGGMGQEAVLRFEFDKYTVRASWLDLPANEDVKFEFSTEFKEQYELLRRQAELWQREILPEKGIQDRIWQELNEFVGAGCFYATHYIPADRSLFAVTDVGFSASQSPSTDPLLKRFAAEISWGDRWRIGSVTAGDGALEDLHRIVTRIAGGTVTLATGVPVFKAEDGRKLPLPALSSGTQELLPLLNVLERLATEQEHRRAVFHSSESLPPAIETRELVYLEEPEANVFPSTQNELMRLFAWLSGNENWNFDWVITTHSPYILTSFNNLIEAGQAARDNPKLRDLVAAIIPEQYWIKEGDFKAYAIEDGKLTSIMSESGFVEGNYLDQVSERIGDEFDELIRLEYDHSEAS